jgi:hypothetical protein
MNIRHVYIGPAPFARRPPTAGRPLPLVLALPLIFGASVACWVGLWNLAAWLIEAIAR